MELMEMRVMEMGLMEMRVMNIVSDGDADLAGSC